MDGAGLASPVAKRAMTADPHRQQSEVSPSRATDDTRQLAPGKALGAATATTSARADLQNRQRVEPGVSSAVPTAVAVIGLTS
jgi:hypothetical protein